MSLQASCSPLKASACAALVVVVSLLGVFGATARADFGIVPGSYSVNVSNVQAGGHPDLTISFAFNSHFEPSLESDFPDEDVKDVVVALPPGFVGNPQAVPQCFQAFLAVSRYCPADTQVGVITYRYAGPIPPTSEPIYNMEPDPGHPAEFAFFHHFGAQLPIPFVPSVRTGSDYGITTTAPRISAAVKTLSSSVTLWGVPADPSHDGERGSVIGGGCLAPFSPLEELCPSGIPVRPFLSTPPRCGSQDTVSLTADSWQQPGEFLPPLFSQPFQLSECDRLSFEPSITLQPQSRDAGAPSGYQVDVHVPQSDKPFLPATPHVRKAVVRLPEGVRVSPSAGAGLEVCSDQQIALTSDSSANCPDGSKIGKVEVKTPLLPEPLQGAVYQGAQTPGHLLRIFIVAEGSGVVVKLPGSVDLDPDTGQITTTVDSAPQLPFEDFILAFKGGPRAPLSNPRSCGAKTTTATFTSWAGNVVTSSDSFQISAGGAGGACSSHGFDPALSAGTADARAGAFSPFSLRLSREDSDQEFASLSKLALPKGLLASLRGVSYCPESALATFPTGAFQGAAELAHPACPPSSLIGHATVGAGAGANPFYDTDGAVYLAGPYKGAPLSIVVLVPAIAGPFDLGTQIVRSALQVDPESAQVSAVSDPFPTILQGIPLQIRDIRVSLDRPHFTLNPTSCDPMSIDGIVRSTEGQSAALHSRFAVGECEPLAFKPKLGLRLEGRTKRGDDPALRAVLRMREGGANIARAEVTLPHSAFLDQAHIKTICTRVQLAASRCPAGSVYGHARAFTPLLDKPLEGPVYLRSSSHRLPDLVADLNGQIHIALDGRIDSVHGGIRTTFEAVPDAPVSKFVLTMRGGEKGLIQNSRDLCRSSNRAIVAFDAQNGKSADLRTVVTNSCGHATKRR